MGSQTGNNCLPYFQLFLLGVLKHTQHMLERWKKNDGVLFSLLISWGSVYCPMTDDILTFVQYKSHDVCFCLDCMISDSDYMNVCDDHNKQTCFVSYLFSN